MKQAPEDTRAWMASLIERYERPLCSYAYGILRDADRARDAVQETFLRLCRTPRAKIEGHESAWLFRVCRTRALDILRKEKPMKALSTEQEAVLESPLADPATETERQDSAAQAQRLMKQLPANQQEVIRLKFQQQLSYRDIARVTSLSESNVGYLLHVGLRSLRGQMQTL